MLGGGAFAAVSFVQTGGTIRRCVSKRGQLTVLRKGKRKCRKGQKAIAWNQVGRTGTPGHRGATGPPGPATRPAGGQLRAAGRPRPERVLPQLEREEVRPVDDCTFDSAATTLTIKFRAQSANPNRSIAWMFGTAPLSSVQTGRFPVAGPPGTQVFTRAADGSSGTSEWNGPAILTYRDDNQTISIPLQWDVHYSVHQCAVSGTATRAGG